MDFRGWLAPYGAWSAVCYSLTFASFLQQIWRKLYFNKKRQMSPHFQRSWEEKLCKSFIGNEKRGNQAGLKLSWCGKMNAYKFELNQKRPPVYKKKVHFTNTRGDQTRKWPLPSSKYCGSYFFFHTSRKKLTLCKDYLHFILFLKWFFFFFFLHLRTASYHIMRCLCSTTTHLTTKRYNRLRSGCAVTGATECRLSEWK